MAVSCQEVMVEAQASDRIVAPASGASAATIESLRARLLSERAVSKEARQQAHIIAQKVSELQTRLDAEIDHRKKAEAAMNEIFEALKAKGLAMEQIMVNTYLPSESSASEETAPIRGSKDGDSDQSSGEEAYAAHMKDKDMGSANSQGSVDDAVLTEGSVVEHQEGSMSEDSCLDKAQATLESSAGSDTASVENEGVSKNEGGGRHAQDVFTDLSKVHHNVSPSSAAEVAKEAVSKPEGGGGVSKHEEKFRQEQGVLINPSHVRHDVPLFSTEGSGIEPSAELRRDLEEHTEGEVSIESGVEGGQCFAKDLPCAPLANQDNANQKEGLLAMSGEELLGGQQLDARANEAPYPSNAEKLNGMPTPAAQNFPGHGPNRAHAKFFTNNGSAYDIPHTYADMVHNVSPADAPFLRGPVNFSNTAYQSREHLSSKVAELGSRYPQQAPISDAILSLVDDKNGKLGSILMALQLAKQQLQDEEQAFSYAEEKFETPLPSRADAKHYPGFYESIPYQPPYRPWKPEIHNAAPIIHFPMSPTSDHEVSPFERHEGLRRSSSTSAYCMPAGGYDPYLQPKGELHLGNGITLYTD